MSEPNGRTHEPGLREITVELDGLRQLYEERDRRYEDRFAAQNAAAASALASSERLTSAAFAASEKAITKAEDAQRAYNLSHNDLLRKLEAMIPRTEFDGRLRGLDEKLDDIKKEVAVLREHQSGTTGKSEGWGQSWAVLVAAVALIATLLGIGSALYLGLRTADVTYAPPPGGSRR